MIVAYLLHPLGASDTATAHAQHSDNVAGAIEWFRFLMIATRWAISAPWFVYIVAMDSEAGRMRSHRDQMEFIDRADVLVLTGGHESAHMVEWRDFATGRGNPIPILDLTDAGVRPPWSDIDRWTLEIRRRAQLIGL